MPAVTPAGHVTFNVTRLSYRRRSPRPRGLLSQRPRQGPRRRREREQRRRCQRPELLLSQTINLSATHNDQGQFLGNGVLFGDSGVPVALLAGGPQVITNPMPDQPTSQPMNKATGDLHM